MSTGKADATARALEALTRARLRIEELERERRREPIAIVSMACRYPGGVEDPEAYWSLLNAGADATGDIPGERWDVDAFHDPTGARAGSSRTRRGGFLAGDLDAFDADFFGISRREARAMDPQQRLLLEVAWEALERAGQPPRRAEGRPIGVYVGVATHDFADLVRPGTPRPGADFVGAFEMTGAATYAAAGRISYTLGLTGPSLVVDTACSSSLVAVHLAVQALRNGECEAALAGGVNCILGPEGFVALSQANMLASDGRCKSFDASADGMGRGEGCGLVLLQRLGDARRSGAPILGLILGSAINQDGPSGGFTVPSGRAQRAVLRAAAEDARVSVTDIDYVEAHGTGTPLGDPIELGALEAIFGEGRPADRPLLVGSAKANLAHLEGAAGIAGLMRAALAIGRGVVPPHRMTGRRTERFDWAASHLELPGTARPWPSRGPGSSPLAGVSAFGAGGTNVHVILGAAPPVEAAPAEVWTGRVRPILPLSARDPQGLRALAARWAAVAARQEIGAPDLCVTAGRRALPAGVRAVVHGDEPGALRAGLEALARESSADAEIVSAPSTLALLFTGQGGIARGLGRNLFEQEPRFREIIQRCEAVLEPLLPMPLTRWLCDPSHDGGRSSQEILQPALFSFEVALFEVWRAWGIEAGAVMGHSLGEYAAAYAAGMASLEDLLVFVAQRGRLMETQVPGRMVALLAERDRVVEHLPASVSIAADHGSSGVVISGAEADVAKALGRLGEAIPGLRHRDLGVDRAFHSAHAEPILAGLREAAGRVDWRAARLRLVSGLTGDWAGEAVREPAYWARHARETVRFGAGLDTLRAAGFTHFLEIGPGVTLSALAADRGVPGRAVASLGAGADLAGMHAALSSLYAAGVDVDWPAIQRGLRGRQVPSLPTRPWQRVSLGRPVPPPRRSATATPVAPATHPLLGERLLLPDSSQLRFATVVSPREPSFVAGHKVAGRTVFPASGHVALTLAALAEASPGRDAMAIADLIIERPLSFPDDGSDDSRPLQVVVEPAGDARSVAIHVHEAEGWRVLCRASEAPVRAAGTLRPWEGDAESVEGVRRVALERLAAQAMAAGLEPGPAFGAISALWAGEDRAFGVLAPQPGCINGPYRVSPILFDAVIHVLAASLDASRDGEPPGPHGAWMQAGFARAFVHGAPSARLWVRAVVRERGDRVVRADLIVAGDDGRAWLEVEGLQLRRAAVGAVAAQPWHDWLYAARWRPDPAAGSGGLGVSPTTLRDAAGHAAEDWYDAPTLAGYGRALATLDVLAADYVHRALHELGWRPQRGNRVAADSLAVALDVVPGQRRAFAQLLCVLAAHSALLRRDEAGPEGCWIVASDFGPPRSLDVLRSSAAELRRGSPQIDAELTMLERCGEQLADILRGRTDPLKLLFPDNDTSLATRIYTESPGSLTMNALARRAMVELLSRLPPERGLRVLEIGAGTGGTTASLLPVLKGARVRYTFTDVGPVFLAKARERFAEYDFVEYSVLDIENDPCAQGFTAGDFDVVIAANVLHATRDLDATLTGVRRLLAPGGMLFLIEGSEPIAWIDLSFGLTAGWWLFTDVDTRGSYPLISGTRWIEQLRRHGFADASDLTRAPGITHDPVLSRSALIAAEADSIDSRATVEHGHRWMLFLDDDSAHEGLRSRLEAHGERCVVVRAGGAPRRDGELALGFDPADPADAGGRLDGLLDALEREGGVDRVLFAWTAGDDANSVAAVRRCAALLHLTQALLRVRASRPIRLFVLTRAAQAVAAGEPVDPMMAPVWGLVRNVALEHPELGAHLVDVDREAASEPALAALLARASERLPDEAVAVRGGRMHVMRLELLPPAASERTFRLHERGWILITGGQRGIGWEVARFLAGAGHRHLALLGRSAPEPAVAEEIEALRRSGTDVRVLAADVANEAELASALDALRRDGPPIRAVIHSAGVFRDHLLRDQHWSVFEQVLAPKVAGSWNLHRLTRGDPLEHFICFSSGSSLIGATGLSSYVTANAFVDALAVHRRSLGLPALTINWGAWREVGMAAAVGERREAQWHAEGIEQMETQQALDAFAHSVSFDEPQLAIIAIDRPRFLAQHRRGAVARFLEVLRAAPGGRSPAATANSSVRRALATAGSPAARRRLLEDHLERMLAELLGLPAGTRIDPRKGFFNMGLDSLLSVELRNRLQADLDRELPSTLTFRFPTPLALLDFLCGEPQPEVPVRSEQPAAASADTTRNAEIDEIEALSSDELEALINDNFDTVSRGRR
ncbi:SDR family NAD(P)-dependent oxidoreductase [Archangium violaceum]|uniref:SDR family NAD(P)-dependent oxidoreductase n=1 Tax=Archangium violaceum TaxID=83451 RepID=UPI0036D7B01C